MPRPCEAERPGVLVIGTDGVFLLAFAVADALEDFRREGMLEGMEVRELGEAGVDEWLAAWVTGGCVADGRRMAGLLRADGFRWVAVSCCDDAECPVCRPGGGGTVH